MSTAQKLDYLIEKVERLDRTINPPWWKRLIGWMRSHWLILGSLFGIMYGLYSLWDEIQMLISFVQTMNDSLETIKGYGGTVGDGLGTAKDTIMDTFKGWNFWE